MREADEQETLFNWMRWQEQQWPELALAYHIPNGGKRNAAEAAHLKRLGVKPGVPDICIPVARGGYHGLYIEMKAGRNKATELQKQWLDALTAQGYRAEVCTGWEAAAAVVSDYMEDDDVG